VGSLKRYPQISAFIIAGGASSRMGRVKGLLEIAGEPLIVRTARMIAPLVTDVAIVGSPELYAGTGLRKLADRIVHSADGMGPVQTPLAGIVTALHATSAPWNLILACDLPYLTADWVDWLLARALASHAQIVIPRNSRGLEPLAAAYRRECATPLIDALERGIRKVTDAIAELPIEELPESDWSKFDPLGRVLKNMNTPSDYDTARNSLES
jgi:molybdopterin-guanine dinucleotide biosynthesis protein A